MRRDNRSKEREKRVGCMDTGNFVMKYGWILLLCGILGMMRAWGQPISSSRPLLLTHATVHVGDGRVLEDISIVIDQGVITQVVPTENFKIEMSRYRILDVNGQHVYPGFILPNTRLGFGGDISGSCFSGLQGGGRI